MRNSKGQYIKGNEPESPFKKGIIPWNKGKKTGLIPKSAFKKGCMSTMKGKHHSLETKLKISISNSGENCWKWKGGVTKKNVLERAKFCRTVKKEVLKRDNYQCVECGSKEDITVDHIKSWAKYPELRFNINNCRTLCKLCHYLITFDRPFPNKKMAWGHTYREVGGYYATI